MIELTINDKKISVTPGTTILKAAEALGITIPTLCHAGGLPPKASCMICAVREMKSGKIIPSCESLVEAGMEIETNSPGVIETRKNALELLLSEHKGECEAPCLRSCPLNPDIPEMLALVREGNLVNAEKLIRNELPFAGVLCGLCSAPCEKGCRRKRIDQCVAIKDIIQSVIKINILQNTNQLSSVYEKTGRKAAVIGSGPAGISCAHFLLLKGHDVTLYHSGEFLNNVESEFIKHEIDMLKKTGADIIQIDETSLNNLQQFDALIINQNIFDIREQNNDPVFECRDAVGKSDDILHSAVNGKEIAKKTHDFLTGKPEEPAGKLFNSLFGRMTDGDMNEWMKGAGRNEKNGDLSKSESVDALKKEADRCLSCGCSKKDNCSLRYLATEYKADRTHYAGEQVPFSKKVYNDLIIETGKCVKCGICARISKKADWDNGFTFLKRGFDLVIGLPLDTEPDAAHRDILIECIEKCPTGALSLNRRYGK